ncbi:hypothetical protein DCAR_0832602 [Daucus carota subsp. sativus]|uniref:Uncharacterized protein n=2 Tax=Daucus carota subsp. sativus TaxID=79200 RepID=A0AAF0XS02_DAUCS|nr:hypothetical protein DCAR_0832602 [Daucus carota subsp. sativus]
MDSNNGGHAVDRPVKHNQIQEAGFYKPNIWKYDLIESLTVEYAHEKYERMVSKLREEVKYLLSNTLGIWEKLELIDNMEKLGLAYLFESEIKSVLDELVSNHNHSFTGEKKLYNTALLFKLLRKHGYTVSQDVLEGLVEISPHPDVKAVLKLFEASHLAFEGEDVLEKANVITRKYLMSIRSSDLDDDASLANISRTLEDPHNIWYNVKTQIQRYETNAKADSTLLNLAKHNFNMFQAIHQKEVKELLRWWRTLEFERILPFTRNRILESFVCAAGIASEPKFGSLRNWLTKSITLILVLDDVYDASGCTLEELENFTTVLNRRGNAESPTLPECMKICMRILNDTIKDIASQIEVEYGWKLVSPHLQKAWSTFSQALLKEARWFNLNYTPSIEEHTDNGRSSSSGPLLSLHIFFALIPQTERVLDILKSTANHEQNVALIFRLCNDLGNFAVEIERSDPPSSIQCIMKERGVSEEVARNQIKCMIASAWKKINYECVTQAPLLQPYLKYSTNIARVAHVVYHNGDAVSNADGMTRNHVMDLLGEPLSIT